MATDSKMSPVPYAMEWWSPHHRYHQQGEQDFRLGQVQSMHLPCLLDWRLFIHSPGCTSLLCPLCIYTYIIKRIWSMCWPLFRYPLHTPVTSVARKNPGHSAKSAGGRLQFNTHALYGCGFAWSDVIWCMVIWCTRLQFNKYAPYVCGFAWSNVIWCTQNTPRWQQFRVAPAI